VSPLVFAHAGHWLPQLLYVVPVAILVVAVLVGRLRERRSRRAAPRHTDDTD
jgi:cytochrome c-type biogenesis protein CcmH/NrfF